MLINDWLNEQVANLTDAQEATGPLAEGMNARYQADMAVEAAAYREAVDHLKSLAGKVAKAETVDEIRVVAEHELCDLLLNASINSAAFEAEIRGRAAKIESRVYRALFDCLDRGTITVGEA